MLELRQSRAYGVNGRYLAAIVVVLLLASAFAILVPTARAEQNPPVEISPGIWETAGDWIIEPGDFVTHGNKTINVNGNLTIQGQGTLVLYNVTLTINNTLPGQYHIEVMSGGTFFVYDGGDGLTPEDIGDSDPSMIQAPNPGVPFLFWIRPDARFLLNRSRVGACGLPVLADPTYGNDLGVYSESDYTIIEESYLVQNSVGFIANHSRATIRRSLIAMQTYGVVAAENAVLEITDLDLIWSQTHGIFVNGSRMFLNDSYIWRNGIVIGGEGIYATMNSALFIDNTTIEMNAWNGAVANNSFMSVTDSDVIDNGRVGLLWMSDPSIDVNPIALDNYVDNHATGLMVSSQASASVEFLRNNITGCMGAVEIYGADIMGNVIDNNISDAIMGIYVDGLNVSLNISRNTLDTIMDTGIFVLPMLSVTADISMNRINNTFGMGGRAIYIEPQGPSDLYFALNTITNVSGVGIGVFSPVDGDIVASAYLNRVTNTSTMCGFPACGGIGFYSQMGEVDVRAIGNVVNLSGDGGILVISDLGNVTADIRFNVITNTGFMPMMFPVSIGTVANMGGWVQADVMNNTIVNDTVFWGILAYGDRGFYGNVSGNLLLDISDLATYVAAGMADVNLNFSDNAGNNVMGVLWSTSGMGNGDITMTGNWFTNFMGGYQLDFFGGNLTLMAQGNTMRTGDWFHLWISTGGWLEAYLGQNTFGTTLSGTCVDINVWGHSNITADGNSIFSAALDGFKLEAGSANIFLDQNVLFANRVNFNVSTFDTSGHLHLESLNDAFRFSSASYSLNVYAAGTSNLSFVGTSFNSNSGPANLFLNQSSDISLRYVWSSNNLGAPNFWINHPGSQLNLYSYASSFESNEIGVIIDSSGDITAQILSSNFDRNQMGSGLEMYTAFGADISLVVDDSSFSSNGGWGLVVMSDGGLQYTGTANVVTANQMTGMRIVSNNGGNLSMTGTIVAGNCMMGGCFGMEIGSNGPRLNAVLDDLIVIGNNMAGMIMFNTDMTATDLDIRAHEYGLYSFFSNATIESSTIIQNTQGVYLDFESHFTVFNSSLESVSMDDFILDLNSSLWGVNTTFSEWGMIWDVLSWVKKSWFYDILVRSDTLVPLPGAFVDGYDALGGYVVNGTTDMDGYLRLNIADEVYRELGTTIYYNPHMLNATLPSVGFGSVNDSIFFYKVVIIELTDVDAPFADAGPDQIVPEDTVVQFDGTNSSDNVKIFSFTWTFTDQGIPITLNGPTPTYTFAEPGVYIVTLEVSDNTNPPASDTVQITVLDVTPPVANAGADQNVASGTLVTFDGSGSTDNVGIINYTWTFTYDGSPVSLYDVGPAFLFVTPGEYTVTLTVADNATLSDVDTMTVTVTDMDPPVANAGPNQMVDEDTIVTFDGSSSTDNIGITSYRWTFIEGTNLVTLEGVSPTYTFADPGFYAVTLEVRDDAGWSDTDVMEVTVLDATPPTVIYTSPQDGVTDQPLNTVMVIGFSEPMDTDSVNTSTSIDSGATIVAFNWNSPQDDTVTLTLANLANSVTYTITIDSTATDKAGISIPAVFTTSFRTRAGIGGDTTSPTVVYSDPEDSETNVPISILIVVVFSEPMVSASVESAISIPGASILSYNWGPNDTLLEITIAPLSYSTSYTITISDAGQDLVGNPLIPYTATFTTENPPGVDVTPPEVIYTNPEDGSTDIPTSTNVVIVFSEEMNTTSVEAAISISGVVISGFQWFSGNTSVEVLLPSLSYTTTYTVTIADTAADLAGNTLAGPYTTSFETEAPPGVDVIRPFVTLSSPADGAGNVPVTTAVFIVFSEAMNETSVEGAISISGISILAYTWSSNSTMVELTLPALGYSATYTVSINTNATDLSDNQLYAWSMSFTTAASTADTTSPEVVYTYPEDGQVDVPIDDDVIVVFNEPMSRISVESSLMVSGATIEGFLWNSDSTRVTVRLADLDYDTGYILTIGSGAEDPAGNSLSPLTVTFTTMSEYGDAVAPFDILQAWWLIVIIIVLIVIIALLLLLKREPAVPSEAEPEEPIPEEPGPPSEEPEAEESALSEEDLEEPRELPDPPMD